MKTPTMSVSEVEQHVSSKLVSGHGKIERPVHIGNKNPSSLSYSIADEIADHFLLFLDSFVPPTSDKKNNGETARISLPDGPMPMPITGTMEDINLSKAAS